MTFGTLYTRPFNPRSTAILAVAKAANLPLDLVTITSSEKAPNSYLELNPLGKIPTFVSSSGLVLSECIAIAVYITAQSPLTAPLLAGPPGSEPHSSVLRWMSFANTEILPSLGGWFNPLIGRRPFVQEEVNAHRAATLHKFQIVEDHLAQTEQGYLVGEELTLADLFVAGIAAGAFMFFLDAEWRGQHQRCTEWFERVAGGEMMVAVAGKPVLVDKAMERVPPGERKGSSGQ